MSKIIKSPVKRFPGEVVLSDPLTFPQVFAFEDALNAIRNANDDLTMNRVDGLMLPGLLACVEEFKLEGIPSKPTLENFPATPRKASAELIAWLIGEITDLYKDADDIPNE